MLENIDETQKNFFDNHLTSKEVCKVLNTTEHVISNNHLTKVKIPDGFPKPYRTVNYMYSKKEVYDIKEHNDFIIENCIPTNDAVKYLGISRNKFSQIIKNFNIEHKEMIGFNGKYYIKTDIEMIKEKQNIVEDKGYINKEQEDFFDNHMSRREVLDLLKTTKHIFDSLEKIKIPDGFPIPRKKRNMADNDTVMYSKEKVYEIKKHNDFIEEKYITHEKAAEYLDVSIPILQQIVKEFVLEYKEKIGFKGKRYFVKDDIEEIKVKQREFWEKYINTKEINTLWENISCNYIRTFGQPGCVVPTYAKMKTYFSNGMHLNCWERDAVLGKIYTLGKAKQMQNTFGETYFETFKLRLDVIPDELAKFNSSGYTKEKWFEFVESKLTERQHQKTATMNIAIFVKITEIISRALQAFDVAEIYALNSKQIALVYNWNNISQKMLFHNFLVDVEEEVRLQLLKTGVVTKSFSLEKVNKIKDSEDAEKKKKVETRKKQKKEIYDFEVWANLFDFLIDIKLHAKNSVDKIEKDKDIKYPSVWLYLILHLNNAWRNGDAADFPRLHIHDLITEFGIDSLDWFKCNELTVEQSRRVITRVINREFKINKTQIKGHFFSSDVLAPAFATAVLIIEIFLLSKGILDSNTEYVPLLNFGTQYNQPSRSQLKNFIKGMDGYDGFVFRSKFMNKSVMTYIWHLANMSGDDNALKYVQKLRNHMDKNSPLHYVDFDLKRIESLTKHLFRRGEFGYIPSLLIQRIKGEPLCFEEMTEAVYRVNNAFNGVFKLNSTVGFLNAVKHERAKVVELIEKKSLKECQQTLTDLFTDNLPSKEKDIQCLVSKEDCRRTDKECLDCEYHIPTIYAITSLCKAIIAHIREYNKTINIAKQFKLALRIERKMIVLSEAIKRFGSKYVYNCLGMTKEELLEELDEIAQPEEFYELLALKSKNNK